MISRRVKNKNYSTISNVALNDPRLSLKTKGLYAYLMSKPDTWEISREGIRSQVKESRTAIDSALKELEDAGYLRRERTKKDEHGRFKPESVLYEEPLSENRPSENQLTENQPQVSTDRVSTELVNTEGSVPTEQASGLNQRVDRRDPEVTELVEKFETAMDLKLPKPHLQRRAASTLIKQHSLERCLRAVDFVVAVRGQQYAPGILSLEELRDKWNKLEEYGRREGSKLQTDKEDRAIIEKMTGVKL